MRAAVLHQPGTAPEVGEFQDPEPSPGRAVVQVAAAGLNPVDLMLAAGAMGSPRLPAVAGREGVGVLRDGRRVYFNSPIAPFGSWAQRTVVDPERTFPVRDDLSDELAVTMGIAGLAAWLPLTVHAALVPGERVLVLGATGVVGQIAVQAAKLLGAGRVVGAGRDADALGPVAAKGADATVVIGEADDARALREQARDGYDVVIDIVYGAPVVAAFEATAPGARVVTIGAGAGDAAIPFRALQGRSHIGHGTQFVSREIQRDAYARLTEHAARGNFDIAVERFPLHRAAQAWQTQAAGPHRKLVVIP